MTAMLPVLVVEDEELLLSFLKTALERGGITVLGASSGTEALACLQQGDFGCVISDLRLPGSVSGAEIFDWVREHRPELASRFLFITGNAGDEYAVKVRERTGAQFVEKPFRVAVLIDLIKKVMSEDGVAQA